MIAHERHVRPARCARVRGVLGLLGAAIMAAAGCDGASAPAGPPGLAEAPAPVAAPVLVARAAAEPAPRPLGPLPPQTGCINAECHASFPAARHLHFAVSEGGCFVCHREDQGGHTFPLLRAGNDLCTFCHATGSPLYPHAALEGQGCTACHRPHASDAKFLLAAGSIEALCRQCHALPEHANLHGPMRNGECTACHLPHGSDHRGLLRGGDVPDHCFTCHRETGYAVFNAPHVHSPVAADCLTCHDPHSSDQPHALALPIEQACFACHQDVESQVAGASAPHAAVFTGERCANCHDAHASGRPALLRDREDSLCLACHGQPVAAADGRTIPDMGPLLRERDYLHGPVRAGQCSACHNVHGASHARLLRQRFTDSFYAPFDLGNYALCFDCHEQRLVTEPRTTALTGFRDGDVNLHYMHVNRQKGRTCRACHEIHGSDLPRHLAESVPFEGSGWAMPIGFQMTTSGGSCAPGCHEPKTYRRDLPTQVPAGDAREGPP